MSVNGQDISPSAHEEAKQGLLSEVMRSPIDPNTAAISAYVNGMLQSARLSALAELLIELATLPETVDLKDRFETLQVEQLLKLTEALKVAREGPRIALAKSLVRQ